MPDLIATTNYWGERRGASAPAVVAALKSIALIY